MTISLQVPSMVCDGCVSVVKDAIITQEPQAKVEINLENKNVKASTIKMSGLILKYPKQRYDKLLLAQDIL